ncbi:uncharacterized protein [Mytilus edulis]|uniref:uncharacterized protein isoform X1 n=1 Tax=Mytilus edulis TaxID=6550 RepID=UPI0039EFCAF1
MAEYCQFGECWRRALFVQALVLFCFSVSSIAVALVYASDCPHEGYRLPFFLLAAGLVGLFDAVMIFFSNTLWSSYKSFRCEGSKETVKCVNGITGALSFVFFIFVFVGLVYGASADDNSLQCLDVVWKFTLAMCSLGLISFILLGCVCMFKGDD